MRRPRQLRQNLFLHFAEPRLWLKLLQLTVKVRSFEGRPHGCSSAAFRWVWHFLKGSPSALWSAVDLRDSGDEPMPTKCLHSSPRRTCRTGHQPGFSHPPFHCGAESRRQMREQINLTSPQMPHGKSHCLSRQPPPQAAFCCVQSTIT